MMAMRHFSRNCTAISTIYWNHKGMLIEQWIDNNQKIFFTVEGGRKKYESIELAEQAAKRKAKR